MKSNQINSNGYIEYFVPPDKKGERLDTFLAFLFPDLSRNHIQQLIKDGHGLINRKNSKSGAKLKGGDIVSLFIPPKQELHYLKAEDIPLNLIYEDQDVIVINKMAGTVVHPGPGHRTGTLINALMYHVQDFNINGTNRPGLIQRLDKDTSGLMVIAKTDKSLNHLLKQMQSNETVKEYRVLVDGVIVSDKGIIEASIGQDLIDQKKMMVSSQGKYARTSFTVLEKFSTYSYINAKIDTGRTHQIRLHFSHLGYPVVGDRTYGKNPPSLPINRQFLHSHKLIFKSPTTNNFLEFISVLPSDLEEILLSLKK